MKQHFNSKLMIHGLVSLLMVGSVAHAQTTDQRAALNAAVFAKPVVNTPLLRVAKATSADDSQAINLGADKDEGIERYYGGLGGGLDDAGVPEKGELELNVWADADIAGKTRVYHPFVLDMAYGLEVFKHNIEISAKIPYAINSSVDEDGNRHTVSGLDRGSVGVKVPLLERNGFSVASGLEVEGPIPGSGSVKKGVAEPGTSIIVPFIVTKEYGKVFLVMNAEYEHTLNREEPDDVMVGLGAGTVLTKKSSVMVDLIRTSSADFHTNTVYMAQARYVRQLRPGMNVFISGGRTIGKSADGQIEYVASTGFTVSGNPMQGMRKAVSFITKAGRH